MKPKKILFVCTSNKDRSPALQTYFALNYPNHLFASAGVNEYFCKLHDTALITPQSIEWADIIVCAENIHLRIIKDRFTGRITWKKEFICLDLGEMTEINKEDYLTRAEMKIKHLLY